jgi:fibronectin-binding autotransporter adhesin
MAGSTFTWIGGSSFATIATNWSPTGGPGAGDTAIIPSGTVVAQQDAQLHSNTVEIGGTAGATAAISFTGDALLNAATPTVDSGAVFDMLVPGQTTAESALLLSAGTFINQGSIIADGVAGSSFTVDVTSNGTAPGYFINYGQMTVQAGDTLTIAVGANSEFFNAGEIAVNGGSLFVNVSPSAIAGGYAPVFGAIVIDGGGTVETNAGYASSVSGQSPIYAFADQTSGNTLKIDNIGSFGGQILGFGTNDIIDLGTSLAVGQIVYSSTTGILNLENASGTILASLNFASGNFTSGTFALSGTTAGSFAINVGTDGNTVLSTGVQNHIYDNTGGTWQTGSTWSNGVPGPADTAIIGDGASSPFILTTGSTAVSVGQLSLVSDDATLQITSDTTAGPYSITQFAGSLEVTSGQTLTAPGLRMSGGTVQVDPTGLLDLTGHTNLTNVGANNGTLTIANGNTTALRVYGGTLLVNGGTINAGAGQSSGNGGSSLIGYDGSGTPASVTVQNSGSNAGVVTDTYALLSSDPTSFGVLTLNGNASWTDEIDPHDTATTRGYMVVGDNNEAANSGTVLPPPFSGTATLTVENGATLIEQTFALIGESIDSAGSVTVTNALWNIGSSATGGYLNVGQAGTGALTIGSGGTVAIGHGGTFSNGGSSFTGSGITVGQSVASTGTIVVETGGQLTDGAGMTVGQSGTGDVQILNGGTIQLTGTNGINLGSSVGAFGTLLISGTNSSGGAASLLSFASSAKGVTAGVLGQGTLDVESGGTFQMNGTGGINAGQSLGATGVIIVDGPNALISEGTASTGMGIGQAGAGSLLIENGGTLLDQGTLGNSGIGVGQTAGAQGLITVTGTNSLLSVAAPSASLNVGVATQGTLNVQSGGKVSVSGNGLIIGANNGGSGTVSVSGSGSSIITLGTTGNINVGNPAHGVLNITAGGSVSTAGGVFIANGTTTSSGTATVVGGTLSDAGQLTVGSLGSGTLDVGSGAGTGGLVQLTGASGGLSLGGFFPPNGGGSGTVVINGGTLTDANGPITVGNTNASGTLLVENGGSLIGNSTFSGATIDATGSGHASATISGGTFVDNASLTIGASGAGSLDINSGGHVTIGANGVTLASNSGVFPSSGTLTVETAGTLTDSGGLTIGNVGNGTLDVTGSAAVVNVSGFNGIRLGDIGSSSGTLVINGGTVNDTSSTFTVGTSAAAGTLLVEGGGLLTTSGGAFPDDVIDATGVGQAAATVSGGTWNSSGQIVVGNFANGSLDINSGGVVNTGANALQIGSQSGSSGTVTVESGGTLDAGSLNVSSSFAGSASGSLKISDGGLAQLGSISVNGGGAITVGGTATAALLTASSQVNVGQSGNNPALLTINQHGTVQGNGSNSLEIASGFGAQGTVTVNNGTLTGFNGFGVGNAGTGVFLVENNGQAVINGGTTQGSSIGGTGFGSNGTLIVNSGGTLTDTGSQFSIGGVNTTGSLLVEGNGLLTTTTGFGIAGDISDVGSGQAAATVTGATWIANGNVVVGDNGSGSLDINSNGLVNAGTNSVNIGQQSGGAGTLSLESGGTLLAGNLALNNAANLAATGSLSIAGGAVTVSGLSESANSTVTVSSGSLLVNGVASIGQAGAGATLTTTGGKVTTTGGITVGVNSGSSGTINVNGGTLTSGGQLLIGNQGNGLVNVNSGGSLVAAAGLQIDPFAFTPGNGTLVVNGGQATDTGQLTIGDGGDASVLVEAGGTFTATGTTGIVSFSIGTSAGGNASLTVNDGLFTTTGAPLFVGDGGSASVLVENAGTVLTTDSKTGPALDITGSGSLQAGVVVTGTNSALDLIATGAQFIIGDNGSGSLAVSSSAVVNAGSNVVDIGNQSNGSGSLSVSSKAQFIGTNGIDVGANGSGALSVSSGGTVNGTGLVGIGESNSSSPAGVDTAQAVVTGTGSLLEASSQGLAVGDLSSGSLTVSQGGSISATTPNSNSFAALTVGRRSTGSLTVTDSNSSLAASGAASIGLAGAGNLLVENHGSLSIGVDGEGNDGIAIGGAALNGNTLYAGGSGTAQVVSNGDLFSTQSIIVGENGDSGALTINTGGTVEAGQQLFLGSTATLASGGTLITSTGSTTVGSTTVETGNGVINVGAGGVLKIDGTGVASGTPSLVIGSGAGSSGALNVSGAGATVNNNAGGFDVGGVGLGSLAIQSGGTVITSPGTTVGLVGADIASGTGSDGSNVSVTGNGSDWQITGSLLVGDAAAGSLAITAGGTVTADSGDIGVQSGASGNVSVIGTGSALTYAGQLTIGDNASAELSILNGATVNANNADIGLNADGTGNVDIEVAGSRLDINNNLNIGDAGVGVLTLGNNTELTVGNNINVGANGILNQLGGSIDPSTITIAPSGRQGGHGSTTASVEISNAGTLYASSGTETVNTPLITAPSGKTGILEIDTNGDLVLNVTSVDATQSVNFTDGTGILTLGTIGGFGGTIATVNPGDEIIVQGTSIAADNYNATNDVLTLFNGTAGTIGTLQLAASVDGFALLPNGSGGITVAPCFVAGTRISTERGEVAVEDLCEGDRVQVVLGGRSEPVVWVGHRTVDCTRHPKPHQVWPVRIAAGAFGPNRPSRELWLSPDHAVYIDDVLIPVKHLINGTSIVQRPVDEVTYYHVELPRHTVLLADGLAAESYLDTGDRSNFANGAGPIALYPDFASRIWDAEGCAPLVVTGPALDAARRWVNGLAGRAVPATQAA